MLCNNYDAPSTSGFGKGSSVKFLKRLFGFDPAKAANSSRAHSLLSSTSSASKASAVSPATTRRELLRLALRHTLNRHGIPISWVGAETLSARPSGREPGIHLRILIRHWEPRLLHHAVALQNSLIVRLLAFDPLASNWLMGISWQFDLPDESACPPMPHPGSWTADLRAGPPDPAPAKAAGGSGDVIAGPVRISPPAVPAATAPEPSADVKSDLERLFAVRDAELKRNTELATDGTEATQRMYLKTRPVFLKTEPMPLEPDPPEPRS